MNLEKKKKTTNRSKSFSWWWNMFLIISYFFGFFRKKNFDGLESSKFVLIHNKRKILRKEIKRPYPNPNDKIKSELTEYGLLNLTKKQFQKKKKNYLLNLSKKKQEDYAYDLRKYRIWLFIYPFYYIWFKFIRIFNLDFILNKNANYEFSNDQLETLKIRKSRKGRFWSSFGIISWFGIYYNYLKEKIQSKKYQTYNWITFITFTVVYIIILSILIAYASYVVDGKITTPPFSQNGNYPNFFFDKFSLAYAIIYLSGISLVFVCIPFLILVSLWLSNINDTTRQIIFVYFQQLLYLIVGIFIICSASMELTLFFAH